jgi:hypothetical protein
LPIFDHGRIDVDRQSLEIFAKSFGIVVTDRIIDSRQTPDDDALVVDESQIERDAHSLLASMNERIQMPTLSMTAIRRCQG